MGPTGRTKLRCWQLPRQTLTYAELHVTAEVLMSNMTRQFRLITPTHQQRQQKYLTCLEHQSLLDRQAAPGRGAQPQHSILTSPEAPFWPAS